MYFHDSSTNYFFLKLFKCNQTMHFLALYALYKQNLALGSKAMQTAVNDGIMAVNGDKTRLLILYY